ncbi:hypothetical protein [Roseicyclus amphidinii]|uniref:hypothetical protein n=1 Tax=Roseicyclus amphidinii TaxID=3034232 RepID=UPI0024E14BC7|nr:hypothetical protein [Roseicyclus sp. Amp-Y-6]
MAIQINNGAGGTVTVTTDAPPAATPLDGTAGVGTGVGGVNGPVPDTVSQQPAAYASMLAGLAAFAPDADMGDFETRLAEVAGKLQEARGDASLDRLKNEQELKKQQIEENKELLQTSQDKAEGAEVARDGSRVTSGVGALLQGVAAVAMIIGGAALMAVPGGATQVAGVALIVAGGFMAASAINSGIAASTDHGMGAVGSIAMLANADADTARTMEIVSTITLAVGTLVASVVAAVASGGVAAPAAAAQLAATMGTVSALVGAAGSLTSSAGGMVSSAVASDAAHAQADLQEQQAGMQQTDDRVDQLLSFVASSNEQYNAMIDAITEMALETAQSLTSARFAG